MMNLTDVQNGNLFIKIVYHKSNLIPEKLDIKFIRQRTRIESCIEQGSVLLVCFKKGDVYGRGNRE